MPVPRWGRWLLAIALIGLVGSAGAQQSPPPKPPAPSDSSGEALQVTVFGILALPQSNEADPRLADVAPKLRKLLPGYGFRRVGLKSRRLAGGGSLTCDMGEGRSAKVELVEAMDANGKVKLKFTLSIAGQDPFVDVISTPPNQLVLVDRMLPSKQRLLIGLAAR